MALVERLRTLQDHYSVSGQLGPENHHIFAEAADEIERLRTTLVWIAANSTKDAAELSEHARKEFEKSK